MRENKLPVDTVRSVCLNIHQFCISLLFQPDAAQHLSASQDLPMLKRLIEGGSLLQLEKDMQEFVCHILAQTGGNADDGADAVHTVQNYVRQHYAEDLSLESLAGIVYLSPAYLSRLFKRETGETLSAYVQNIRIEQAKTLLRTTSLKTYEVAERVGIPDPVYFSRIFKKVTGSKPRDFRRDESTQ